MGHWKSRPLVGIGRPLSIVLKKKKKLYKKKFTVWCRRRQIGAVLLMAGSKILPLHNTRNILPSHACMIQAYQTYLYQAIVKTFLTTGKKTVFFQTWTQSSLNNNPPLGSLNEIKNHTPQFPRIPQLFVMCWMFLLICYIVSQVPLYIKANLNLQTKYFWHHTT